MTKECITLEVPAQLTYLRVIGQLSNGLFNTLEPFKGNEELKYDLELIISEACTNVIKHAYPDIYSPGKLRLVICFDSSSMIIQVIDYGPGFEIEEIEEPDLEYPQEGGLGLFIIRQLVDKLEYRKKDWGNILHLEKNLG